MKIKINYQASCRSLWMWKLPTLEEEVRQIDRIAEKILEGKLAYPTDSGIKLRLLTQYIHENAWPEAGETYLELNLDERALITPELCNRLQAR